MPRRSKMDFNENYFDKGQHAPDLRELGRQCLCSFLSEKLTFRDQPISKKLLYSEESFRYLRTPFDDDTFNFIHDKCLSRIPKLPWYREATVPWNVHYLLGLMSELKLLQIPKEFQPGLLLLYFKHCKGFEVPPAPLL